MNVKEMVKVVLVVNGFNGLYDEDGECACQVEDLMPCGGEVGNCQAGWLAKSDNEEYDYLIVGTKPVDEKKEETGEEVSKDG